MVNMKLFLAALSVISLSLVPVNAFSSSNGNVFSNVLNLKRNHCFKFWSISDDLSNEISDNIDVDMYEISGECDPGNEYCILDESTGSFVRPTIQEKERVFLDALQVRVSHS